jgi:ankyrin repeat protein
MKLLDSLRRSQPAKDEKSAPRNQKEARLLDFLNGGSPQSERFDRDESSSHRSYIQRRAIQSPKRSKKLGTEEVNGLIRLVYERKHFAIMYILLSDDVDVPSLLAGCGMVVGEPFLHFILKSSPNPEIVELLLAKMGGGTDDALLDSEGRTALHVAAGFGCDAAVIKLLLDGDGRIQASVKDNKSRTPLHWACFNPNGLNKDGSGKVVSAELSSMLDTVAILLETFPGAIHSVDKKGKTPLDLAMRHHAEKAMIEMLEGAAKGEAVWEKRGISSSRELTIPSSVDERGNDSSSDLSSIAWDA